MKPLKLFAVVFMLLAPQANAIEIKVVTGDKSGVTAWLVEDHTNPIIFMEMAFRGGASLDPMGKEGLSELAASTMDEGAGDMDSQVFRQKLEDLAISLSFNAARDSFSANLKTLSRNKEIAFDLMRLALTKPRFDAQAVERIRRQLLAGLRRSSENPRRIAGRKLFTTLYPDHVYARPTGGTMDSMKVIKIADLRAFVGQRLGRNNLIVGVVGDITPAELKKRLDATFGGLPAKATPWTVPEVKAAAANRTIVVDKAIPQSIIRFAQIGVKRDDPDFFSAYVMNYVLGGGGFESRLYEEVREKRGLAYSAFSYLLPMKYSSLVLGGAGTANERVKETIDIMRAEWRKMADSGLSQKELIDAKTYLTGSYPLRFSSSGRIAGMLTGIQLEKLGIDYIDKRNALVDAVTLADVNRVAKKMLQPDNLTLVVVGRPKGVASKP
jgi:zinc protease